MDGSYLVVWLSALSGCVLLRRKSATLGLGLAISATIFVSAHFRGGSLGYSLLRLTRLDRRHKRGFLGLFGAESLLFLLRGAQEDLDRGSKGLVGAAVLSGEWGVLADGA